MEREKADCVAVAGDARRERLWLGVFERKGEGLAQRGDYELVTPSELASRLPAGAVLVSSQWERLAPLLEGLPAGPFRSVREDLFPQARHVALQVMARIRDGSPSDALAPIYMHPPVDPLKFNPK